MKPKISIIIPSYNQALYLEQTLRSVLDQDYDNTEIIIIDGASKDDSVNVIKKYEPHLACWVSEPDNGQTDAINKGLSRMTGDVWMYLNSDDLLLPGALSAVARAFADPEVMWVGGAADIFDETGIIGEIVPGNPGTQSEYLRPWNRSTEYVFPFSGSCFMRRSVYEEIGPFDSELHYSMDIDYYLKAYFQGGCHPPHLIPEKIAAWRWHDASKTMRVGLAYGFRQDEVLLAERYRSFLPTDDQRQLDRELLFEKKQLIVRRACYLKKERGWMPACTTLLHGLATFPSLIVFRPWLGAWRRLLRMS